MSTTAVQVHCPTCHAVQPTHPEGNYLCEYCLSPFTIVDARREESRLLEEIKRWVEARTSLAGGASTAIDASSRAFIFRQKICPDIQRDVDRALEDFGISNQYPLITPPIAAAQPKLPTGNPLLTHRPQVLALHSLRARLVSDQVTAFAQTDADRGSLQSLDRRVANLMLLSNVAEASARREPIGYAGVRRNLRQLLEQIGESLRGEAGRNAPLAAYLGCLQERYRSLTELAGVCEELTTPNPVSGESVALRVDALAEQLQATARNLEKCDFQAADTIPMVMGVDLESKACRLLSRWLRAYDALASGRLMSFTAFVADVESVCTRITPDAETKADLLDLTTLVVQAIRGETAYGVVADLSWLSSWAEENRAKKTFGLFGAEERASLLENFLVPVWVAEVRFSQVTGIFFVEGAEKQCVAVLDASQPPVAASPPPVGQASAPTAGRPQALTGVCFLKTNDPSGQGLFTPAALGTDAVALPRATQLGAAATLRAAAQSAGFVNPQVKILGLGFIAVGVVSFESKQGARQALVGLNGRMYVDRGVRAWLPATRQLLDKVG